MTSNLAKLLALASAAGGGLALGGTWAGATSSPPEHVFVSLADKARARFLLRNRLVQLDPGCDRGSLGRRDANRVRWDLSHERSCNQATRA